MPNISSRSKQNTREAKAFQSRRRREKLRLTTVTPRQGRERYGRQGLSESYFKGGNIYIYRSKGG